MAEVPAAEEGTRIDLSLLGRYRDPVFGAAGLPAVSADGTRIAYSEERLDGGRGNPNARLVIRIATQNRPAVVKEILPPSPRWTPDDEAVVRGRLEEVNQLLAKTEWIALEPMLAKTDAVGVAGDRLTRGTLTLTLKGGAVTLDDGGRVLARRTLAALLKKNAACPGKPMLAEAYVGKRQLLVRFMFESDGCFREAEYHAVTW